MSEALDVLRGPDLRGTLSPLRRQILAELQQPASATVLAERLGHSRQRLNYHLRELEKAGLVELVETRPRRGTTERILRATARTVVVAPEILGQPSAGEQDRYAVETLLTTTAQTVDDVAAMRERARAANQRLITFSISAEIGFAEPAEINRFADDLAAHIADLAATYDASSARRRYRLVVAGHPTPPHDHPEE